MKVLLFTLSALAVICCVAGNPCEGLGNQFLPQEGSCPGYIRCFNQQATYGECAAPYSFNVELQACSYSTGDCAEWWLATTTVAPEDLTMYECDPAKPPHFLPHASVCAKYVLCYAGTPIIKDCAEGMAFDPAQNGCVDESLTECLDNPCPAVDSALPDYFPHPRDCGKYFICYLGQPIEFTCPAPNVFDPTIDGCNAPEKVEGECGTGGASPITTAAPGGAEVTTVEPEVTTLEAEVTTAALF